MSLETTTSLNQQTLDALQELIQINIDSADGFRAAAEDSQDIRLSQLFVTLGTERSAQATELQKYVAANHQEPRQEGSTAAALHRAWISIRDSLSSDNAHAALAEAERGEDEIKAKYEQLLKQTAGSAVNDVLLHQYRKVKAAHDQVRELRDSYAA